MKSNELRVGNLLNWMGCVCPVVEIDNDNFVVADITQSKLNSNYHYSSDEVVTHWELTEDWLIKLGFKQSKGRYGNDFIILEPNGFVVMFAVEHWTDTDKKSQWHNHWFVKGLLMGNKLQYVHQLQNLYFALTGIELELKELC